MHLDVSRSACHMCPASLGSRRARGRGAAVRVAGQAEVARPSPLDCSRFLASIRAAEAQQAEPIMADPYAASLASAQIGDAPAPPLEAWQEGQQAAVLDAMVTRFLDEQLLKAVMLVNLDRQQEYNQVVIVGDAMDTRPFRLPWPAGTIIYLVGAGEVHALSDAVLKQLSAHVPRGCLLRRVAMQPGSSFADALERAGFRGDRLSVWALQGANRFGVSGSELASVLEDTSNLAAFDSLVLGELPAMTRRAAENLLAEYGLLGAPMSFEGQPGCERLRDGSEQPEGTPRPWLFISHQKRLSLRQMGIYSDHVAAAEEIDEDFFGNFS